MREYREVPQADYERCVEITRVAFGDEPERTRRWLAGARPGDLRGIYEDGRLVTQMEIYPLTISSGRGTLGCGGVSAVATPPEERRRGHVGMLLREGCAEMRARGMQIAMLGAFKDSFYGQYGWMTFAERRRYSGGPELFLPFRSRARAPQPIQESDVADLDAVYRGALRGRCGPLVRSHDWWRRFVLADDYWGSTCDGYIWRDEQGQARAYTIFQLKRDGDKRTLRCREMVALDPHARAQLFSFLANFDSQVDQIVFHAPADAPVNLLFPDPLECAAENHFMVRVLDVPAALERYGYPREARGRLTLAVRDGWIADNDGVFALEVADGRAQVTRLPSDAPAGLRCDVRALGPLLSRLVSPRKAAAFGLIEAPGRDDLALAEELLAGLAPFISDRW